MTTAVACFFYLATIAHAFSGDLMAAAMYLVTAAIWHHIATTQKGRSR
ncbi:hypothetical protein ACWF94_36915 [Streptomyces sp. NPDC055078]